MSLENSHQISEVKVLLKKGADGAGIANIEKTGTSGNVDTYTITLTNGDKYTFTVTNGGGGHEIENAIGQKLTQRDLMQFLDGLDAVDDAQGEITKVKLKTDYISLADWNAMTEEEQETYKQEHFRFGIELPDTEGVINAEYMTKLWENPDSTQSFASQNITLASADYDMLRVYYNESVGGRYNSVEIPKGVNGALTFSAIGGTNSTYIENRSFTRNSDTSYTFGSGQYTLNDGSLVTDNSVLIPIAVYGIKKDFQFKVNAIANELSTRADHCFLDDEVTTVEDAINNVHKFRYIACTKTEVLSSAVRASLLGDLGDFEEFVVEFELGGTKYRTGVTYKGSESSLISALGNANYQILGYGVVIDNGTVIQCAYTAKGSAISSTPLYVTGILVR